jgi:hypothetical protein
MTIPHDPVFVVGSSRSGTTMFRLMLNRHSRLHIPPETWFLTDLMNRFPPGDVLTRQQIETAVAAITAHWRWREWGIADQELRDVAGALDRPTLADLVDAMFRLAAGGKARWGDKTPGYLVEIERLHRLFPRAQFVHVVRDGRDVCVSLRKTGWHGDVTWSIARYWSHQLLEGRRQGRALGNDRYLEIGYRELVLDTDRTLRQVCAFLDEPFEPAMLAFHETADAHLPDTARMKDLHAKTHRAPRPSDLDRWQAELHPLHVLIFEAGAGAAMRAFGQPLRYPRAAGMVQPAFALLGWAAAASLPVRSRLGIHLPRWRRRL